MPELTQRRRMLVLAICCLSVLLVSMDNTIVNIALPAIQRDLNASVSGLQWTIDAYVLVLASLLMLSGSTADRLGRRRTFQTGLVLFTAGSLFCGLAPSLGWLIAARILQAVGGSMLNPVAMSIITTVFPDPRERARAIGVWSSVVGLSMALGPIVGGLLTETAGWRWIFIVNVPIGAVAVALAARFVPESKAAVPRRLDLIGQALVIISLASLIYAIIEGPQTGWESPEIVGLFTLGAIAAVSLIAYERRRTDPLLQMGFFRSVPFSGATVIGSCAFAAFGAFLFLNTIYLQDTRGYSALIAGVCTLPMAVASFACAPLSGRLVATRGTRLPLLIAGASMLASAVLLTGLTASTPLVVLLVSYLFFGIGFGMVNSPITATAVAGMPRGQAGVAAAVASTSRQVGQSLGVAIGGSIAGAATVAAGADFAIATHPAWWFVAGCASAIIVLSAATTGVRARRSAESVGALFDDGVAA